MAFVRITKHFDSYSRDIEDKVSRGIAQAALAVEREAVLNHAYTDRTHNLTNSIGSDSDGLTGRAYADAEYAQAIELGRPGARPRPFLRPALAKIAPRIKDFIRQA